MLSILVCHSYFLRLDRKQSQRCKPYPPLATLQVVAMLRGAGYDVSFFDAMLAAGPEEFASQVRSSTPQVVLLYEDTFNFLSKMCLATMRNAACEMIGSAKRAGARAIAAGPDVTDAPAPYLRAGADFTLAGEGLAALLELLARTAARPDAGNETLGGYLPGVGLQQQGRAITGSGPALPVPPYEGAAAWDLVDVTRYRAAWVEAHGYFSMNLAGSRGCSFRCAWCAKPTWGNQYLQRSPEDVAAEMVHLKRAFGADHIWFADDIFGFRVDWVARFAQALSALGGGIPFTIQTRADLVSARMADALKKAGCAEAWLGAESGSQQVLDAMNKGTRVEEIITARDVLKGAGVRVGFFIQLGYLGERLADILATRELLRTAQPDEIGVSVSYPLPGTRFYDIVKTQLGGKTRWDDSNDLEMMFHGTYTSDFYRAVRHLLHDQVALQTAGSPTPSAAHRSPPVAADAARPTAAGAQVQQSIALERRWQDLVGAEARYRSPASRASVAG
jgi:anaerobic magnesium-protoporphyrin IX monomethyl ester cyclase